MSEDKVQHQVVKWFSQKYPHFRGLLFEINNNPAGIKHAMKRRAMGMISGVSDLIFIVPDLGVTVGIEIKAPNSLHSVEHIKNQMEWGRILTLNRGYYIMTSDANSIMNMIECLLKKDYDRARLICQYSIEHIKPQLKKKTVKF